MTTSILWRPEINSLTSPQSYRPRHMARATFGNEEVAARIALRNPVYNEGLGKGFLEELSSVWLVFCKRICEQQTVRLTA
jgi:hypothetical protein